MNENEKSKIVNALFLNMERAALACDNVHAWGTSRVEFTCWKLARLKYDWALRGFFYADPGYGLMTDEERKLSEKIWQEKEKKLLKDIEDSRNERSLQH